MTQWKVDLEVWLKPSVFDPQGHAVEQALHSLGHKGASQVRIGKSIALTVTAVSRSEAETEVRQMCETVFCNPVMETYEVVRMEPADADAQSDLAATARESVAKPASEGGSADTEAFR